MPNEKVAFFDFCETLVNFQTADAFVDFVRKESKNRRMIFLQLLFVLSKRTRLLRILQFLFPYKDSFSKRFKLYQLKGFTKQEVDSFAKDYYYSQIRPNFIERVLDVMKGLKDNSWEIVLVSGGYDVYLKEFAYEFGLNTVICSKLLFVDGICKGVISGKDCLGNNKIELLEKKYLKSKIESKAFSDSFSDLPLLTWVDEGYVISHNNPQKWVDNYNLKEIVW